jgi:GAF domain-containing protein
MSRGASTIGADQSVEDLGRELSEARQREAATAEILKVISSSPTDLERVFAEIAASAARLCDAHDASIRQVDGEVLRLVAHHGPIPISGTLRLSHGTLNARAVLDRRTIHVADLQAETEEYPEGSDSARLLGHRTMLVVPLICAGEAIGAIAIRRTEVRPFTDRQIDLLKTFADQAVIAIENTRLFEAEQARTRELTERTRELTERTQELTEALEYQTATSEVLSIISRSPYNLRPVLDTIVETAVRLLRGYSGTVTRVAGDQIELAALTSIDDAGDASLRAIFPQSLKSKVAHALAIRDRAPINIADAQTDPHLPEAVRGTARARGYRSWVTVPLLRRGEAVGTIAVTRREPGGFNDEEISLLQTFADQAVIAIENTRLFEEVQARTRELTKSLEYQTAISDVLAVLSRSPSTIQPVLDTIVQIAERLCKAEYALIFRRAADGRYHVAANRNATPTFVEWLKEHPIRPGDGSAVGVVLLGKTTVHMPDRLADARFSDFERQRQLQVRTSLGVPLMRGEEVIGVVFLARSKVDPFSEKEIELVTTFADQAVIAIENARLFEEVQTRNSELRVALEQQTATSDLLKVIGRSTFDLQPVFETLAENACRLCEAKCALVFRFDGRLLRFIAGRNVSPEFRDFVESNPLTLERNSNAGRAALQRSTVHNLDVQNDSEYDYGGSRVDPYRTVLAVPMLRIGALFGVIVIYRHEVRPFSDSQIALMETFADQAVIAIENARLLEELQARNSDLTALGEVGRAVSSTLDLEVVLKAIVDRAVELSGTDGGSIFYYRGGRFELGETTGLDEKAIARFHDLDITAGQTGLGEAIAGRQPLQVPDIFQRPSNPLRDAAIDAGFYAGLIVPLFGSEGPLGALVLQRRRTGEFAPSVVSLMESFADQSAIALENARLFKRSPKRAASLRSRASTNRSSSPT